MSKWVSKWVCRIQNYKLFNKIIFILQIENSQELKNENCRVNGWIQQTSYWRRIDTLNEEKLSIYLLHPICNVSVIEKTRTLLEPNGGWRKREKSFERIELQPVLNRKHRIEHFKRFEIRFVSKRQWGPASIQS